MIAFRSALIAVAVSATLAFFLGAFSTARDSSVRTAQLEQRVDYQDDVINDLIVEIQYLEQKGERE